MTFTGTDILLLAGLLLSVLCAFGGFLGFFYSNVQDDLKGLREKAENEVDQLRKDFIEEVRIMKDTFAHKETIDLALAQINAGFSEVKQDTSMLTKRIDDFQQFITQTLVSLAKDKK